MKKYFLILLFIIFLTGCNLPISNCVKGYHEFDEGNIMKETSDATIIKYKCENCFESYEISTNNDKLYFEDVWFYSFIDDLKISSSIKYNEYDILNEYQTNYFNDLLEKMRKSELNYMNEICNCTPLVEVSNNGKTDNYFAFSFHKDHLVLKTKRRNIDFWYVIQECSDFKLDMFNEIYEWVNVEENIINSKYDNISNEDLENLSKNLNTMKFDIGFDEFNAIEGAVLKSSVSIEQMNELIDNHYSHEYYKDIEIVVINETDYYFYAITNYKYGDSKAGQRYLISFKQSVYDYEKDEMYIKDKKIIKLILDTLCCYAIHPIRSFCLVHSEIIEEDNYYTYVKYEVETVQGDWDCPTTAYYKRTVYKIYKESSIIEQISSQIINTVAYGD